MNEPALAKGNVRPLNRDNSSQWLSFYARRDAESGQTFLIVTNLHGSETMKDVQVNLSAESLVWLDVKAGAFRLKDRLSDRPHSSGTRIGDILPMTSLYFEIERGGNVVERGVRHFVVLKTKRAGRLPIPPDPVLLLLA